MSETTLDLSRIIEDMLEYARGKGQIPDLPRFMLFLIRLKAMEKYYGMKLLNIDKLIRVYSINAPAFNTPLWLKVIDTLTKINSKTEIVQQLNKRKNLE